MNEQPRNEFENASQSQAEMGVVREFLAFLRENKKWWLLPIIVIALLMGLLISLSGSAVAPFIYTLF